MTKKKRRGKQKTKKKKEGLWYYIWFWARKIKHLPNVFSKTLIQSFDNEGSITRFGGMFPVSGNSLQIKNGTIRHHNNNDITIAKIILLYRKTLNKVLNFITCNNTIQNIKSYHISKLKHQIKRTIMTNLHHSITHKIILKSFELQLQNWGEINE